MHNLIAELEIELAAALAHDAEHVRAYHGRQVAAALEVAQAGGDKAACATAYWAGAWSQHWPGWTPECLR